MDEAARIDDVIEVEVNLNSAKNLNAYNSSAVKEARVILKYCKKYQLLKNTNLI